MQDHRQDAEMLSIYDLMKSLAKWFGFGGKTWAL